LLEVEVAAQTEAVVVVLVAIEHQQELLAVAPLLRMHWLFYQAQITRLLLVLAVVAAQLLEHLLGKAVIRCFLVSLLSAAAAAKELHPVQVRPEVPAVAALETMALAPLRLLGKVLPEEMARIMVAQDAQAAAAVAPVKLAQQR
jgi:hypothetical protein